MALTKNDIVAAVHGARLYKEKISGYYRDIAGNYKKRAWKKGRRTDLRFREILCKGEK